jgi:phosphatidylglycerol lysyltransferase
MAWDFRELVEEHGGWPAFYDVGSELLHEYLDMGFSLLEIGEEARVPLADFSTAALSPLHSIVRSVEEGGYAFEVVAPGAGDLLLPRLREIAAAWRSASGPGERGFSVGGFDADFARRFPLGVARDAGGRPVAFAVVLPSADHEEMALELVRYLPGEAPPGILEYLTARLMEWARDEGWRWFSLGTAPHPAMEARDHGPLWQRAGGLLFRHGEHFRRFDELRAYEQQFAPHWEPRYLASPGGLVLPRTLAGVSALIAGGTREKRSAQAG